MRKKSERLRCSSRRIACEALEPRTLLSLTPVAQIPDVNVTAGTATTVNLDAYFSDPNAAPNLAIFNTTLGTIPVVLTPGTTPLTVANFLSYVNSGAYTNTIVHRSVPGFIWQTGGFTLTSTPDIATIPTQAPVQNEFGASNVRGTIAMAKLGGDPNSATDQFFFNESDSNASNLNHQNGGFTVFGHVLNAAGLAVMDVIAAVPVPSPSPFNSPLDSIPLQNYNAAAGVQVSNLILINSITTANEYFTITSDAPGVATAIVQGGTLSITTLANGTAHFTVVGYGSDGNSTTETFAVNVADVQTPPDELVTPPSVLMPAASGSLPTSAIAGQKAKIKQTVSLGQAVTTINQNETVSLLLSRTTTGGAGDVPIANVTKKVKVTAGKQSKLTLSAKSIASDVPAGTYHVLVSVTDPDGSITIVDTGKTFVINAPQVDLSGAFLKTPTTVKIGKKVVVQVQITNNGNVDAVGTLTVNLATSGNPTPLNSAAVTVSPAAKVVHIKPGKTLKLTLAFPAGDAPASFYVIGQLDPANLFNDVNLADNVFATSALVTVA